MANQDFTTYTLVQVGGTPTATATRMTWTNLARTWNAYGYYDFGVGYFGGNFTMYQTLCVTAFNGTDTVETAFPWVLANKLGGYVDVLAGGQGMLYAYIHWKNATTYTINASQAATISDLPGNAVDLTIGTVYYLKIVRDESVGANGTLYIYVYSDSGFSTPVGTSTLTLTTNLNLRYLYPLQGIHYGSGSAYFMSGYTENMSFSTTETAATSPSVSQQAVTAIDKNTATANGNVLGLGSPAATQYGHVWAKAPVHPTTSTYDGHTEKGVPATGAFTSDMTGLTQSTLYNVLAYVRNSLAIAYGNEVTFTTLGDVPVVTTDSITEVLATTALGHGTIANNGGSAITQHGICWSTSANPTTADSKTEEGAVSGDLPIEFSSLIADLTAGTAYHARIYATNGTGTGYGADITFTTMAVGVPIVTTDSVISSFTTTALAYGTLVDLGTPPSVTQYGHCWSTTINPTTTNSKTTLGTTTTTGAFSSPITGLTAGTAYYCRAYATNLSGTGYGNNILFNDIAGEARGDLRIQDDALWYTDKSGIPRYIVGTEGAWA